MRGGVGRCGEMRGEETYTRGQGGGVRSRAAYSWHEVVSPSRVTEVRTPILGSPASPLRHEIWGDTGRYGGGAFRFYCPDASISRGSTSLGSSSPDDSW